MQRLCKFAVAAAAAASSRIPPRIPCPVRCSSSACYHCCGSHFNHTPNPNPNPNPDSIPNSGRSSSSSYQGRHHYSEPDYQDDQARRVLQASLRHVTRLGWAGPALIAGAKEVGVSPAIVGTFRRKEAALVEFFMDECLQKLIDKIDSEQEIRHLIPSNRVSRLVQIRLEMQAPYISKWPQALSIQGQPLNLPTGFKQRALLVDEIWHAAGDETSDIGWYVKRTVLGGIYSATELYMLTDNSPDFHDTWAFLDDGVKDAFDMRKTIQEGTYLAEAVGAGIARSLQGFMAKVVHG